MITTSPEATEAAAARLARCMRAGDLLLLSGEMGAGKTTFVRGLARGLGVTGHVASPTFQLVRTYPGPLQLAHVDLYRVSHPEELAGLGLEELLDQGAVVVEWGERLPDPDGNRVAIEVVDERRRRLRITEAPDAWSW